MLPDRLCHRWWFAAFQGVDFAHCPLQAGHFDYHGGNQVRLTERGGLARCFYLFLVASEHLCDLGGQRLQAGRLLEHRAEFGVECEGIQTFGKGVEGLGGIFPKEEVGIGVAGADDALIALPHYVRMFQIVGIGNSDKARRQS